MQAFDARTGELIWENHMGPVTGGGTRGLAIFDDKIFFAASDARLVALDARSGHVVWESIIGDRTEGGYRNSSGPLVIGGRVVQGLGGCDRYREEKCFISAYNAEDGSLLWKFNTIARDLEPVAEAPVLVRLTPSTESVEARFGELPGICIDDLAIAPTSTEPDPDLLFGSTEAGTDVVETVHSHLLRTNCPITNQPDWASDSA